jgi:hypothetical protein
MLHPLRVFSAFSAIRTLARVWVPLRWINPGFLVEVFNKRLWRLETELKKAFCRVMSAEG